MAGRSVVAQKIYELLDPVVREHGCELLDVEYLPSGKRRVLRLIIDSEAGVGLDECSEVSLAAEPVLDGADLIPVSYDLEVSSPGADRPIETDRDFERNTGRLVEILLKSPVDRRSRFEGSLDAFTADAVTITLDEPFVKGVRPRSNGTVMSFGRDNIRLMRRAIRF